jgi:hypothetical protein
VLDATGETIRRLQIRGYPTSIVINPSGELVGEMRLSEFRKLLGQEPFDSPKLLRQQLR